ncbi:MAG: DUF1697 domain-containing protein [Pricia sp.]
MKKYVGFLRGINVGGHHKVPMAELRSELEKMDFKNVATILNSGNILFEATGNKLEEKISKRLETVFGFPVPTLVRNFETIAGISDNNPFAPIEVSKDIRFYVSFLKNDTNPELALPWKSGDGSYEIIEKRNSTVFSVLDLSVSKTPKAMEALEKLYGKDITTRNWNTIARILKKAKALHWL